RLQDDSVGVWSHDARARTMARDGDRIYIRHVGCDDGRHDDALGSADDSYVRPSGPTDRSARHSADSNLLVWRWLFPCLVRFLAPRYLGALGTCSLHLARLAVGRQE